MGLNIDELDLLQRLNTSMQLFKRGFSAMSVYEGETLMKLAMLGLASVEEQDRETAYREALSVIDTLSDQERDTATATLEMGRDIENNVYGNAQRYRVYTITEFGVAYLSDHGGIPSYVDFMKMFTEFHKWAEGIKPL